MPARMHQSTTRGWSYWEPTETLEQGNRGYQPENVRLFHTRLSASAAASNWAKGTQKREQGDDYDYMVIDKPAIPRSYSDLEIVEGEVTWKALK